MEALGPKIRRRRRRLGFTLDELAGKTCISKPYLSLIETERVPNPPSDEKLRRIEQSLEFTPGELISQAHLQRTPGDVRAMLQKLIEGRSEKGGDDGGAEAAQRVTRNVELKGDHNREVASPPSPLRRSARLSAPKSVASSLPTPINLDDAYLSGVLQELVDQHAGNIEHVRTNSVPVINRVSAGYPRDFTDLSYPPRVADDYVGCPDVRDSDAFAARVHGDSMTPKYREGDIVIFSPAAAPKDGDDCFVRFADGNTTFKRVFFENVEDGKGTLRLQPRNERYKPQVVVAEEISGIYKAVYRYQRVDEE